MDYPRAFGSFPKIAGSGYEIGAMAKKLLRLLLFEVKI
jgi:hypothetical protein